MTVRFRTAVVGVTLAAGASLAAQNAGQAPPGAPTPSAPQAQTPSAAAPPQTPAAPPVGSVAASCPAPVPPATAPARAFGTTTGLLLHQVQPARVADFERFLLYVRDALARTTNATVRNQARGWKFFKVSEPGPNGDVLYAFLLDPAVPCVDYALGPIVADAYPDPAQLQEIWKLYTGSVRSGGSVMNLVTLPAAPPPPIVSPATTAPGASEGPGRSGTSGPAGNAAPADPAAKPASANAPSAPNQAPPPRLDADPAKR